MDEYTIDAFANRDEPVPLLMVPGSDDDVSVSDTDSVASSMSKASRLRRKASPSRLKEKAQQKQAERIEQGKTSLQDRMFAKLLGQVIPTEGLDEAEVETPVRDRRSSKYVKRPEFSLPMMANNFRRFNARIGIVFVFQNRLIRLFTWRRPTHTISFLATYTFVCLDPYLLAVLPLAICVLFIMIPAFISRHPPAPPQAHTSATTPYYSGPAIAPARTIKPAAETSKDFFRNMRDLQNSMADFSNAHDTLVALIAPATNFSDEILSSTIFLYLFFVALALFVASQLLPWRLIVLTLGYGLIISGHPTVQNWLLKHQKTFFSSTPQKPSKSTSATATLPALLNLPLPALPPALHPLVTSISTITLNTTPETREVEIFELQYRPLLPLHSTASATSSSSVLEWQHHLFTPTPYDPLSPSRISGDRPHGARFFEDVGPPRGWEWGSKKWELDLEAGEWVNERLVVGVEYGVTSPRNNEDDGVGQDRTLERQRSEEGEFGGWVWDLPPPPGHGGREEEVWLAYGEYEVPKVEKERLKKTKEKEKRGRDWEEAVRYGTGTASGLRTGEWRRRRWTRVVRRKMEGDGPGSRG